MRRCRDVELFDPCDLSGHRAHDEARRIRDLSARNVDKGALHWNKLFLDPQALSLVRPAANTLSTVIRPDVSYHAAKHREGLSCRSSRLLPGSL